MECISRLDISSYGIISYGSLPGMPFVQTELSEPLAFVCPVSCSYADPYHLYLAVMLHIFTVLSIPTNRIWQLCLTSIQLWLLLSCLLLIVIAAGMPTRVQLCPMELEGPSMEVMFWHCYCSQAVRLTAADGSCTLRWCRREWLLAAVSLGGQA